MVEKIAWDGFLEGSWSWVGCNSRKAFCRIEGAISKKREKKGAGWSAPKVLRIQAQKKTQAKTDLWIDFWVRGKPFPVRFCWACLRRSRSYHPPCAEQRELPLFPLEHLAETCSKGSNRHTDRLHFLVHYCRFKSFRRHTHADTMLQAEHTEVTGKRGHVRGRGVYSQAATGPYSTHCTQVNTLLFLLYFCFAFLCV